MSPLALKSGVYVLSVSGLFASSVCNHVSISPVSSVVDLSTLSQSSSFHNKMNQIFGVTSFLFAACLLSSLLLLVFSLFSLSPAPSIFAPVGYVVQWVSQFTSPYLL